MEDLTDEKVLREGGSKTGTYLSKRVSPSQRINERLRIEKKGKLRVLKSRKFPRVSSRR